MRPRSPALFLRLAASFWALGVLLAPTAFADVVLNELLARNTFTNLDEDGDSSDWIELYNRGETSVPLSAWSLGESEDSQLAWALPEVTLASGAHLLVWCSGKDRRAADRPLHTDFRLSSGDTVRLFDASGRTVDSVTLPGQTEDHSWGRSPDGDSNRGYLLMPTPAGENDLRLSPEWISDRPLFFPPPGAYGEPRLVRIEAQVPFAGFAIRFTLDGSEPSPASRLYVGPLQIAETQSLCVAGYVGDERVTRSVAASYLIDEPETGLPILSITMAAADFELVHTTAAGRGIEFERFGHLELLEVEGRPPAEVGFGLRLHGGGGRGGSLATKKSYRAYFRGRYGDGRLRFPVIARNPVRSFDRLILRAGFNDAFRSGPGATLLRDQLLRDVHADMGALTAGGDWYALYVNGRGRGIYNVVERLGADFLRSHSPGEEAEQDIVRNGDSDTPVELVSGNLDAWRELNEFLDSSDLRQAENFERVRTLLDVESFSAYVILHIWAQNLDWPFNNWYAARPRRPEGRWRFLTWDSEVTLQLETGPFQTDSFQAMLRFEDAPPARILGKLLENEPYQRLFVDQLDRHAGGALEETRVIESIDRLAERLSPALPWEIDRALSELPPEQRPTPSTWDANVESLREFTHGRGGALRAFVVRSPRITLARVLRATPNTVEPRGEVPIELRGTNLTESSSIRFAGLPAARVRHLSSTRIEAWLPYDLAVDGSPEITLVDPLQGEFTSRGLLDVQFPRPMLSDVEPISGTSRGGERVRIRGSGFVEGLRIEFDDTPARVVSLSPDGGSVEVITPPHAPGDVEVRAINLRPGELPGSVRLSFRFEEDAAFLRGDADGDGRRELSDAVRILAHLFQGRSAPCRKALDSDDDGRILLTDAVSLLRFLFSGGPPPPAPSEQCGEDPTPDDLDCTELPAC